MEVTEPVTVLLVDAAAARELVELPQPPAAVIELALPQPAGHDEPAPATGWQLGRYRKLRTPALDRVSRSACDHTLRLRRVMDLDMVGNLGKPTGRAIAP